jgi:hypothetical protein
VDAVLARRHLICLMPCVRLLPLVLLGLITGCATAPPPKVATPLPPQYTEASASALAFDPPIAIGIPHPELARGPREPSAFLGYDQGWTEFYYSETDDLQISSDGLFSRQSISARTGVRYH